MVSVGTSDHVSLDQPVTRELAPASHVERCHILEETARSSQVREIPLFIKPKEKSNTADSTLKVSIVLNTIFIT